MRKPYGVTGTDSRGRIYGRRRQRAVFVIDKVNKKVETRRGSHRIRWHCRWVWRWIRRTAFCSRRFLHAISAMAQMGRFRPISAVTNCNALVGSRWMAQEGAYM